MIAGAFARRDAANVMDSSTGPVWSAIRYSMAGQVGDFARWRAVELTGREPCIGAKCAKRSFRLIASCSVSVQSNVRWRHKEPVIASFDGRLPKLEALKVCCVTMFRLATSFDHRAAKNVEPRRHTSKRRITTTMSHLEFGGYVGHAIGDGINGCLNMERSSSSAGRSSRAERRSASACLSAGLRRQLKCDAMPRTPPTFRQLVHRLTGRCRSAARCRLYDLRAWRDGMVPRYLAAHPVCASCGQLATQVDHVVPHRGDPALFWRWENLQSLCGRCHSRKTRVGQ